MGPVKDWTGTKKLRERYYTDMLYSFDGFDIEHRPIKPKNWSDELRIKFNEINRAEKEPKKALLAWGGGSRRGGRRRSIRPSGPSRPGGGGDDQEMLEMMMMMMNQEPP